MNRIRLKKNRATNISILVWSLLLIYFTLLVESVAAQKYNIRFHSLNELDVKTIDSFCMTTNFQQKEEAFDAINQTLLKLKDVGYLAASIDSFQEKEDEIIAFIFLGKRYSFCQVDFSGVSSAVLEQLALKSSKTNKAILSIHEINTTANRILNWYEQMGFPFAKVMKVMKEDTLGWSLFFSVTTGKQIYFDSIIIYSNNKIPEQFIIHLLDIKKGQLYDERKLELIDSKLKTISFLEQSAPWKIEFNYDKAQLKLNLKEKNSNQLNALIGLMPNANKSNKTLITGDIFLSLQNALNLGETLTLNYQNLQFQSPRLKFEGKLPFVFRMPIGIETDFEFFRKDSSFRRINFQFGVQYDLTANQTLKFFGQTNSSRLITVDTQFIKQNKSLIDADVTNQGIGLSYLVNNLDNRLNPKQGWDVKLSTSIFQRELIVNNQISTLKDTAGFNFSSLYNNQNSNKQLIQVLGNLNSYVGLKKGLVLKMSYQFGWQSSSQLFRNELFQIGGFKTFRGFEEQSIFTSEYHVVGVDLRIITGKNSNIYLFSDNGVVKQQFLKNRIQTSVGFGAMVETKQGMLSFAYALGFQENSSLDIRQAKVHIGYVAVF